MAFSPRSISAQPIQQPEVLPKVFLIGQYEDQYRIMSDEASDMLLSVCNDSMPYAFENWILMLSEMENMADEISFDLKGIKIWVNMYWKPDGTLKHIVYYPKPNSKNMEYDELSAFFAYFINNYKGKIEHTKPFSHYGSASFPSPVRRTASKMLDKN